MTGDRAALVEALGIELPDELLTMALTHRSYSYENGGLPTNERLEFLGDAVLGLTVTEELYHRHPDRSEGDLAKLRASIVNTQALADVGRTLSDDGLGAHLLLGKGEENSGGADKSSILADGVESLLGAIYLEHGLAGAREVILRLFRSLIETAPTLGAGLDWKSSLQELTGCAQHGRAVVRGDGDRTRSRQGVHRDRRRDEHRVRQGRRPHQEGSRVEGRGLGVDGAVGLKRRCLNCPRSRSSGGD